MRHYLRFGHHKCLTRYFNRIFEGNVHFKGQAEKFFRFLRQQTESRFASLNNATVRPDRPLLRASACFHVLRHPKDLIISGYFYHRRGAESWTHFPIQFGLASRYRLELGDALEGDELALIKADSSTKWLLETLPFESGLMLEMVLRKYRCGLNPIPLYESDAVKTVRFEEVMARPVEEVGAVCEHFGLDDEATERILSRTLEVHETKTEHIRDRSAYQYRSHFTPRLDRFFAQQFPRLVERLDYENRRAKASSDADARSGTQLRR